MDDDDGVHRLEGVSNQAGGLIVKKKPPTFKVPQASLLGLDKLAAAKRKEKEDAARKMSFSIDEDDGNSEEPESSKEKKGKLDRKFRAPLEETPTYTGGTTEEARERLMERLNTNRNKEKGVYASTKHSKQRQDDSGDKGYYKRDINR